jgi:hypothetical protein
MTEEQFRRFKARLAAANTKEECCAILNEISLNTKTTQPSKPVENKWHDDSCDSGCSDSAY